MKTKWKLAHKISLGIALPILISSIAMMLLISALKSTETKLQNLTSKSFVVQKELGSLLAAARQVRIVQFRLAAATDPALTSELKEILEADLKTADGAAARLKAADVKGITDSAQEFWAEYSAQAKRLAPTLEKMSGAKAANFLEDETTELFGKKLTPAVTKAGEATTADVKAAEAAVAKQVNSSVAMTVVLLAVTLLISGTSATFLVRGILTPVRNLESRLSSMEAHCVTELRAGIEALAAADLTKNVVPVTTPVEITTTDEIGSISETFNRMLAKTQATVESYNQARVNLTQLIADVTASAVQVDTASESLALGAEQGGMASSEIAKGSERLAQDASSANQALESLLGGMSQVEAAGKKQASSVEEAREYLTSLLEAASSVKSSAESMDQLANDGQVSVGRTQDAMSRLNSTVGNASAKVRELDEAGQKIGAIVQSIDQIASQTNLLALNAAIEAARAGEQGRGFAVVAEEVRKLAEESASSTKQIAELINSVRSILGETVVAMETTQSEAHRVQQATAGTGDALLAIVQSLESVKDRAIDTARVTEGVAGAMDRVDVLVSQNAHAIEELQSQTQEVNATISNVAAVSQEAAASAEEMSATTDELASSAQQLAAMSTTLRQLTDRFKVEDQKGSSGRKLKIAA